MISKLRNFERGKAEKSLLTNNYWFSNILVFVFIIFLLMKGTLGVKKETKVSQKKDENKNNIEDKNKS